MIDSKIRSLVAVAAPPSPSPSPTLPVHASQPVVAAHPFAEMLRQNRLAAARPASPSLPKAASAVTDEPQTLASGNDSNEAVPSESTTAQREPAAAKARAGASARAAASATSADSSATAATSGVDTQPRDAAAKDASAAAPDPAQNAATTASGQAAGALQLDGRAADLAATAQTKAAADDELSGGRDAGDAGPATTSPSGSGPASGTAAGAPGARGAGALAGDDLTAGGGIDIDKDATGATAASFAGLLVESHASHSTTSLPDRSFSAASVEAAQQAALSSSAMPAAASAIASVSLPTPVHSADFAAAFGLQVSVLAKDGVQRAELHLNPADMGPVSIRITLEGSQAHVDFGADAAATRHAIEAGLPELASALRDAGFTLAGGGVAQHSASNGGGGDAEPASTQAAQVLVSSTQIASVDNAAQRLSRRGAAGGLDLYA